MKRVRLALDLFRAEGFRGLAERLADRVETLHDRMEEKSVAVGGLAEAFEREGRAPVLDVLATPLAVRFGGVPAQLGARIDEERRRRATALLSPEGGWWTLRTAHGAGRLRARLRRDQAGGEPARGPGEATEVIMEAARLSGALVVNVEGAAGWRPEALVSLAGRGVKLVVSLHDFALFCPRPNLVEEPRAGFCGYSRLQGRCESCLASTWSLPPRFVEAWRRSSAELLAAADAVVYPSEFLRREHAALFPDARPGRERVIAPSAPVAGAGVAAPGKALGPVRGEPLRVAFVGAYRPHKGASVFEELLRREGPRWGRAVSWSILGSGDPERLLRARRLGARVVGHYRAGSLPRLLGEERIDVALLLSIWPEAYALTLSECREAGVPVLAFAHGAIGERVRSEGGGVLVPPQEGAAGIAAALEAVRTGGLDLPPFRGAEPGGSAYRAATERMELYRTLLGETP